jgi:aryl-alcohol dehydrogenase-like predicted oxidoreductase
MTSSRDPKEDGTSASVPASAAVGMVLGTVQLGMKYGIANRTGQPDLSTAIQIVAAAWAHGVRFYDTAQAYGASEEIMGIALREAGAGDAALVISKLKGGLDLTQAGVVRQSVESSLARLQLQRLWGLMLHDEQALDGWSGPAGRAMEAVKAEGQVEHLGVSVYSVERAEQAMLIDAVDIIQVPANVFDRRFARVDYFGRAARLGKAVFVRSVYLQGLALMEQPLAGCLPPHAAEAIGALRTHCGNLGVSVQKFVLDYVRSGASQARVVVGAENVAQVTENCRLFKAEISDPACFAAWDEKWPVDYPDLVDPRRWPPGK